MLLIDPRRLVGTEVQKWEVEKMKSIPKVMMDPAFVMMMMMMMMRYDLRRDLIRDRES